MRGFGDGPHGTGEQIALRHERGEKQCAVFLLEKQLAGHSDARVGTEKHMIGRDPADLPAEHGSLRPDLHLQPDGGPSGQKLRSNGHRSAFQDFSYQVFGALITG